MSQQVRKRHVFYISGFDPRGAAHYHRLYKEQGQKQTAINNLRLDISHRRRVNKYIHAWNIKAENSTSGKVNTTMEFLAWDDIIRKHWFSNLRELLTNYLVFLRIYIFGGYIYKVASASPHMWNVMLFPALYFFLCMGMGLWGTIMLLQLAHQLLEVEPLLAILLNTFIICITTWATLSFLFWLGNKLTVFWLLRIYIFIVHWGNRNISELDSRTELFANRLVEALQCPDNDEVMIVGHSVGSMLAVSVIARAMQILKQQQQPTTNMSRLVLLTLGECIPLLGVWPTAQSFRSELQEVGTNTELLWVDYTSPADGACCALADPLPACGLTPILGAGPIIMSPRFFKIFSTARYKKLRRQWFTMHFLYLMASEYAGDYDYFAMTAGTHSMASRYARRKP